MRVLLLMLYIAFALSNANASSAPQYRKDVSDADLDVIMMVRPGVPKGWLPDNFSDLAYPWPENYIKELKQPYNSYGFLRNSAALIALSKDTKNKKIVNQQAEFLSFSAEQYTVRKDGCVYITNDFRWPYLWGYFEKDFRGAFMNNVTAYAYVNLYHATENSHYLTKARELLRSTLDCGNTEASLSSTDDTGFFWLNEYVFQNNEEYDKLYDALGYEKDSKGWRKARIYNGHIHALLAFIKYRNATGSTEFDAAIDASIETMRHYLPIQIYEKKYFSYDVTYPMYPDYGQRRAAHLAEGLCKITTNDDLCATAKNMRTFYDEQIQPNDDVVYKKAHSRARKAVKNAL